MRSSSPLSTPHARRCETLVTAPGGFFLRFYPPLLLSSRHLFGGLCAPRPTLSEDLAGGGWGEPPIIFPLAFGKWTFPFRRMTPSPSLLSPPRNHRFRICFISCCAPHFCCLPSGGFTLFVSPPAIDWCPPYSRAASVLTLHYRRCPSNLQNKRATASSLPAAHGLFPPGPLR